jgi:hypothetical protein
LSSGAPVFWLGRPCLRTRMSMSPPTTCAPRLAAASSTEPVPQKGSSTRWPARTHACAPCGGGKNVQDKSGARKGRL